MTEPMDWPAAVELRPTNVAALRVLALEREERKRLLKIFMGHTGQDRMPTAPLINGRDQSHLQTLYEIDLDRIRSLLILVGRADLAKHMRIPVTPLNHVAFTNREWEVARQTVAFELRDSSSSRDVIEALRRIYFYLRGVAGDPVLPQFEVGHSVDLIMMPGCRGNGMRLRVQRALEVLGISLTPSRLFLSGWHPYYARQFDFDSTVASGDHIGPLPFGEADAMAAVVDEEEPKLLSSAYEVPGRPQRHGEPMRRVLVDSRARNTLETVVHSLPIIHETFAALGRPVRLCLVTSPYHTRRFHAITTVQLGRLLPFHETIESVSCAPAGSGLDLVQLTSAQDPRHTDAVALYVRECFKLLGGRATGEF
jgi:hypothetical protein